ncbi:hypothetical protein FOA52_015727 [Chlamydomonas sp. UWO 241]|nr:hypothetical protein FOA52_015727 [Chlamydomonas sp. UWO 241]
MTVLVRAPECTASIRTYGERCSPSTYAPLDPKYVGTSVTGPLVIVQEGEIIDAVQSAAKSAAGIASLLTAYLDAQSRTPCPNGSSILATPELGGRTLIPGLYKSTSGYGITALPLTLDAQGDPDAVFIFQIATTFISAAGAQVILVGGAQAKNVFWQVGTSGTLAADSVLEGTMMADKSITTGINAVVHGRILARIAAVTMMFATFSLPT